MGDLDRWLRRIEKNAGASEDVIELEDGSRVELAPHDRLDALLAAVEGEHHPLADDLARLSPDASPNDHELRELLEALQGDEDGS